MKTSLKNCLSIQAGLIALSESKMLDLKNSFAVAKNIRALEPVIESFNEVKSEFESKIKGMADDEGNVPVSEIESINSSLEEVLEELHVVDLTMLDMTKMDQIDVPAKVIAQVLDIAQYNG